MSIAIKELLRQPRRFVPVWGALTLLVVLLIVLGGFLDGLSRSQTGPYRAYSGDVFVFDANADRQLTRSEIPENTLGDNPPAGIDSVGSLDKVFTVAGTGGANSADVDNANLADVVLYGYSLSTDRLPTPPADGQAIIDRQLQRTNAVQVGDTITVGPSAAPLRVAEVVDDLTDGAPTVWVNADSWRSLASQINPATLPASGSHQALIARPAGSADPADLAKTLGELDGVDGATVDEAIDALAVVQQQNSTFTGIIAVTFIVSLLVVALFFALITLEQSRLYAVLKALGARSSELLRGVSIQALVVTVLALAVGIALSALLVVLLPPNLPVRVLPARIAQISVGLLVTALLGALLTARRILRIDPATAIG